MHHPPKTYDRQTTWRLVIDGTRYLPIHGWQTTTVALLAALTEHVAPERRPANMDHAQIGTDMASVELADGQVLELRRSSTT